MKKNADKENNGNSSRSSSGNDAYIAIKLDAENLHQIKSSLIKEFQSNIGNSAIGSNFVYDSNHTEKLQKYKSVVESLCWIKLIA